MKIRFLALLTLGIIIIWKFDWVNTKIQISEYFEDSLINQSFKLESVEVSGNSQVSIHEIISISDLHIGMSMTSLDLHKIQKEIKSIKWVESVTVRRVWPNTLIIKISEAQPMAIWWDKDSKFLISKSGNIIKKLLDNKGYKNLHMLFGNGAIKKYANIHKTLYHFSEFNDILSLSLVGGRRWDLYIKSNILVKLPETSPDLALEYFIKMLYKKNIAQGELSMVDLRLFPEKIYVKFNVKTKKE